MSFECIHFELVPIEHLEHRGRLGLASLFQKFDNIRDPSNVIKMGMGEQDLRNEYVLTHRVKVCS